MHNNDTRPHVSYNVNAGPQEYALDGICWNNCERHNVITYLPRYDFTISVFGNSMEPDFRSGDIVACRVVQPGENLQEGKVYVLNTVSGILLKTVYLEEEGVRCESFNKKYKDFIVTGDIKFYGVVGQIRIV